MEKFIFIALSLITSACTTVPSRQTESEQSLKERIEKRSFPSIFQAWAPAQNLNFSQAKGKVGTSIAFSEIETPLITMSRHDLIWKGPGSFGLVWNQPYDGLGTDFTAESIMKARVLRQKLLGLNPKIVLLAELRYHDGFQGYLPDDSQWWKRDAKGNRVGTKNTAPGTWFFIDYNNTDFQNQAARQCQAVVRTGVFDGCMFDWWSKEDTGRVELIKKVRQAVGDSAILMVNVNQSQLNLTAPYINGIYMEGMLPRNLGGLFDWKTAANNLLWAPAHLRSPNFTALDAWSIDPQVNDSSLGKNDLERMRFATTLSLTHSNGYVLFALPNGLPPKYYSNYKQSDHLHDWYPSFWDRKLGYPVEAAGMRNSDGSFHRNFQNAEVVCNPPDNSSVVIRFSSDHLSLATGIQGKEFTIAKGDGDIFLPL